MQKNKLSQAKLTNLSDLGKLQGSAKSTDFQETVKQKIKDTQQMISHGQKNFAH